MFQADSLIRNYFCWNWYSTRKGSIVRHLCALCYFQRQLVNWFRLRWCYSQTGNTRSNTHRDLRVNLLHPFFPTIWIGF